SLRRLSAAWAQEAEAAASRPPPLGWRWRPSAPPICAERVLDDEHQIFDVLRRRRADRRVCAEDDGLGISTAHPAQRVALAEMHRLVTDDEIVGGRRSLDARDPGDSADLGDAALDKERKLRLAHVDLDLAGVAKALPGCSEALPDADAAGEPLL